MPKGAKYEEDVEIDDLEDHVSSELNGSNDKIKEIKNIKDTKRNVSLKVIQIQKDTS